MKKITFILIVFLTSCLTDENNGNDFNTRDLEITDEKAAVILDEVTKKWFNKNSYTFFKPSKNDFIETDKILEKAIEKGEFDFLKEQELKVLKEYFRQYICYTDEKNQKIIRINAFCRNRPTPIEINGEFVWKPYDWKNKLLVVNDGGDCYWTAIINLSSKELIELTVNGEA